MNTDRNKTDNRQEPQSENPSPKTANNPFENNQPVDQEIELAKDELEKEQEFKQAQTERD